LSPKFYLGLILLALEKQLVLFVGGEQAVFQFDLGDGDPAAQRVASGAELEALEQLCGERRAGPRSLLLGGMSRTPLCLFPGGQF
jgi:hypothetical protein